MTIEELRRYKKILLLGYAIEGHAAEKFIRLVHPEAEIGTADQTDGSDYLDKQKNYDLAIRTPILRPEKITIPHTTGTNLFFGNTKNKIIGVTGTKGKSTMVTLLHHVLTEAGLPTKLYGNIGKPMLDAFSDGLEPDDIVILELSSYQLEDCNYAPHIGCFLNIYNELHNHESYQAYLRAKGNITLNQKEGDVFFYNGNFPELVDLAKRTIAQTIDFTTYVLPDIHKTLPYITHDDTLKAVEAICMHMGVTKEIFESSLHTFMPPPHRIHNIGTFLDITFYDDSAANHPDATMLALSKVENITTIFLGGQDRGYNFSHVVKKLAEKNVETIILFPETENKIYNEITQIDTYKPRVVRTNSMEQAVESAFTFTRPGTVCLLSPGAPSYTMYKDFNERGDDFLECVQKYATKAKTKDI